jgi:hypothetical protein
MTMIKNDGDTSIIEVINHANNAIGWGNNRRTFRGSDINPIMGCTGLTI